MNSNILRNRRRPEWLLGVVAGCALTLAVVIVSMSPDARSADTSVEAPHFAGPVSFADVVDKVSPAVVEISIEKVSRAYPTQLPGVGRPGAGSPFDDFFERFFNGPGGQQGPREQRSRALGSGFVIDPDGYIVTNNHVIDGADSVVVHFKDDSELDATVIGADPKTDIALIKVNADHKLPYVRFGDSDAARVGDWVLAIGNPFGLEDSATAGIISARGRNIDSGPYDDYLQIDAPINSGNSGGPVFNGAGDVIGINTAIFSPNGGNIGIGFAIPAKQAQTVVAALKEDGSVTRGWLGVQIQGLDEDLAKSLGVNDREGALVAEVSAGSPAERGGLEAGDLIKRFDGKDVHDPRSLSRLVANARPGQTVDVQVLRDGHQRTLQVKLGNAEAPQAVAQARGYDTPGTDAAPAGLRLQSLTDTDKSRLGVPENTKGALVADVDQDSTAADKGLRPGDVITQVDHKPVDSVADAVAALRADEGKDKTALLLVQRGDSRMFVALDLT